jgi:hypothetical protein
MTEIHFTKKDMTKIKDCYAVCAITACGRPYYIYAADCDGPCCVIDAQTGNVTTIWESPGGTMSIVPLPERDGEFLISQRFLPGFTARAARIMRVTFDGAAWRTALWMDLPYIHRFDILKSGGGYYFLGCVLSSTTKEQADFDFPGNLVAAPLDTNFSPPLKLEVIAGGMTRNHGYWRSRDAQGAYTACDEGIFYVLPPNTDIGTWRVEKIFNRPTSDIALCDIDGDGEDEMAAIHPFHGDSFVVYKKNSGKWQELYRYPDPMEFVHAVWGGKLGGKAVFLGGCRAINKELFALYWNDGRMVKQILERGGGPANLAVEHTHEGDKILVANHGAGLASVFTVHP